MEVQALQVLELSRAEFWDMDTTTWVRLMTAHNKLVEEENARIKKAG